MENRDKLGKFITVRQSSDKTGIRGKSGFVFMVDYDVPTTSGTKTVYHVRLDDKTRFAIDDIDFDVIARDWK